ncbi:hypothetical protein SAMN04488510_1428 [Fervidobacterium changbaicum]|uniref:Fibronectin type-III domain-containing protein n=2 Tax=Fervidobacterium TaxID=2422 RepID=A0AAI8CLL0_FERIS|nr:MULTISPECIES: hypothetical protein [Fervidobacterium]AMW32668.1 hypothetical protein NA23_04805 [Fervidobacterium islandicum]QAV32701.1 hypothetical protein CBS1_02330 [Fervidobacterium changbaicum]SDH84193.1 hypothetical protein SAMN04488510_1428 [Fervidobacterium changbaicum]
MKARLKTKTYTFLGMCALSIFVALSFLFSCTYAPKPEFGSIQYDGKVYSDFSTPISVVRSKNIVVNMKTSGDYRYTYKLDGITLIESTTTNFLLLKDHNSKLPLSKEFFINTHTLTIVVTVSGRSESLSVPIRIVNQKPVVIIAKKGDKQISISIIEPDGDTIKEKSIKLYKDDKEISTLSEGDIDVSRYSPGKYKIMVSVSDEFDESEQAEYSFEIQAGGAIQETNVPPTVKIVQPFQNESTPPNLVLRYVGADENTGDILVYDVDVAKAGDSNVLIQARKTKSNEIVIPNLERNTTYVATVTVYDLAGASATDSVTFKTSSKENYLYVNAKDFGGKSLLSILKVTDLERISTVGSWTYDGSIEDFDVVEDFIYVTSGYDLIIINSRDKYKPKTVGTLKFESTLSAIRVYKTYGIVGVGYDKIEVVNLTTPSSPSVFSTKAGERLFSFTIPTLYTKKNGVKKDSINITQGRINDIVLFGDKAYIAADLAGIWELDLSVLPNITIKDIKNVVPGDYSCIDVGTVNDECVLAFGEGNTAGIVKLPIATTPVATKLDYTFDTPVRRVRIHNGKIFILTMDRFYEWDGSASTQPTLIRNIRGSNLHDFYFLYEKDGTENCLLFDEVRGMWRFRKFGTKYELYEPNKIYSSKDHVQYGKFIFLIGDGFVGNNLDGEGLYAIDARDPYNYIVQDYLLGEYEKIKLNPYGLNPKIAVQKKSENKIILYDYRTENLDFSTDTTLDLSSYSKVYDFAIDSRNNIYALVLDGTTSKVVRFDYNTFTKSAETTLPGTISQALPYVSSPVETVEPKNIELAIDNLSKSKETLAVLVALGRAGSMKLSADLNSASSTIFTRYYSVQKEQDSYTLKKYNPGFDQKIIADKYFDRIYVADGEYNGVWLMDRNGVNLLDADEDKLSSIPLFEGAPARNISWFGNKLFVAGGGFGYKIVDVYQKKPVAEVNFSGLTYTFNLTSNDDKYLFVSTDSGLILYDISNLSNITPLFTLSMPMFKVIGR